MAAMPWLLFCDDSSLISSVTLKEDVYNVHVINNVYI